MSWSCLTSGDERSAIKIEGYARNDDGAKRYQNAAALHHFCAALPFLISNFSFKRSFHTQSRGSTPTGLTLKFESRDE